MEVEVAGKFTITVIMLFDVNGDPERINIAAPSVDPPACFKDDADQEEFKPTLESGKGEKGGSKGLDERFSGEGIVVGCEVFWDVV